MNDFLPLSSLTDEELLLRVYMSAGVQPRELELATRLEHALEQLARKTAGLDDIVAAISQRKEAADGADS